MQEQALRPVSKMVPSRSSDTSLSHLTEQGQELIKRSDSLRSVQLGIGVLSKGDSAKEMATKIPLPLANKYWSLSTPHL